MNALRLLVKSVVICPATHPNLPEAFCIQQLCCKNTGISQYLGRLEKQIFFQRKFGSNRYEVREE